MITLRRTAPADLPFVLGCEADPEASPFITRWSAERHQEAVQDPDCVHSIICAGEDGRAVGFALVFGASSPNRCIELRRLVCRERGRGYGRQALRAVQRLAFIELGAHRLWLDAQVRNTRARALYQAEGFVEEGVLRECVLVEGVFLSMVLMGQLRDEWEPG